MNMKVTGTCVDVCVCVAQVQDCAGGESSAVYTLWRTALTHTGQYWCRAGRGKPVNYTEYSEPVDVSVIGEGMTSRWTATRNTLCFCAQEE